MENNEEQAKLISRIARQKEYLDEFKKFCYKCQENKIYIYNTHYGYIKKEVDDSINELRLDLCKLRGE